MMATPGKKRRCLLDQGSVQQAASQALKTGRDSGPVIDDMPANIQAFVKSHCGAGNPDIFLMTLLSSISGLSCPKFYVKHQREDLAGWKSRASLYCILLSPPSGGKTTAMSKIQTAIKNITPEKEMWMWSEGTRHGLVKVAQENKHKGIILISDEGLEIGSWLHKSQTEASCDVSMLNKTWSGEVVRRATGTHGSSEANLNISLVAAMQPEPAVKMWEALDQADGFMARALVLFPPIEMVGIGDLQHRYSAGGNEAEFIEDLLKKILPRIRGDAPDPLLLTPEASDKIVQLYEEYRVAFNEAYSKDDVIIRLPKDSKRAENVTRVAANIALLDGALRDDDMNYVVVNVHHVDYASAIVKKAEEIKESMRAASSSVPQEHEVHERQANAVGIRDLLLLGPEEITPGKLVTHTQKFRKSKLSVVDLRVLFFKLTERGVFVVTENGTARNPMFRKVPFDGLREQAREYVLQFVSREQYSAKGENAETPTRIAQTAANAVTPTANAGTPTANPGTPTANA